MKPDTSELSDSRSQFPAAGGSLATLSARQTLEYAFSLRTIVLATRFGQREGRRHDDSRIGRRQ
jgi:hypothetical protein